MNQRIFIFFIVIFPILVKADPTCKGKFVNPITDICWSCIMPISIGNINFGTSGLAPKRRDIKNPSCPLCVCMKGGLPVPGVSIGFWEPVRLVDITRTPYCMTNLGGLSLGNNTERITSYNSSYQDRHVHSSFYHLHYYIFPLIYWLELITDFVCLEQSSFDVAYMSEFDVTWNDEKLQSLLNPEAFLFGNPIAQAACGIDCAAATVKTPLDSMFWCAGCLGNLYPLSGESSDHIGGIQTSSLLTARILAKMHRLGLAWETSTDENTSLSGSGKLCTKTIALRTKKSQYKLQLTNPRSTNGRGDLGCWPLGLCDMLYSPGNEYPNDGQDFGYLIWRKRNCCAL